MQSVSERSALAAFAGAILWPLSVTAADPITALKPAIQQPIVVAPVAKAPVMSTSVVPPKGVAPRIDPLPPGKPVVVQPVSPVTVQRIQAVNPLAVVDPSLAPGLMGVQKQAAKDAREDRRLANQGKDSALAAKKTKLDRDNASIGEGMQESRDKASNLRSAADAGLATGIVGGATRIGAGAVASGRQAGGADGDIESLVQTTLMQNDREAQSDLRQQVQEAKETNAEKSALHKAAGSRNDAGKKEGASKTVAAIPAKSPGRTKPILTSRPCTPINPC
jgi:hypothetical protein